MLVLSRKVNECVIIDGKITVKVIRVEGEVVKLGFDAPPEIPVHRMEVHERILRSKQMEAASAAARAAAPGSPAPAPLAEPPPPKPGGPVA
ncbi:MAG: carbon storage regulator CsrA [Verrucomicrobia bacterium]|nr:carbon storage regulator CsrA [Verrucomicrobiota bacterium]